MAIGFRADHRFASDERDYLAAVAEQAAVALARTEGRAALHEARRAAESRQERLEFLAQATDRLSRSLDLAVTLQVAADLAVTRLSHFCALYLVKEGSIVPAARASVLGDGETERLDSPRAAEALVDAVDAVVRGGQAQYAERLVEELPDALPPTADREIPDTEALRSPFALLRESGVGALLILPLRTRGRILGAMAFLNRPGESLDHDTRLLAEELTAKVASSIDNAQLFEGESHVARQLANSLRPARLPQIDGLDLAVHYEAASSGLDVGGDFYDVIKVGDDAYLVLVGDVQGKGVDAAAVTGLARHTVKACAHYETSPARLMERLNAALLDNAPPPAVSTEQLHSSALLCTAAAVRIERDGTNWRATASCAGHPLPLLREPAGSVRAICEPQLLLGVRAEPRYHDASAVLEPGATLVLYTDGVSERSASGALFGSEGIAAALGRAADSASSAVDTILDEASSYLSRRKDDLVVLAVHVR
jgi:serine phosphatase RsbU (regulator of sigma subunit)